MGVDITAYSHMALTEQHATTDDCWDANGHLDVPDTWPDSTRGLEAGRHYGPTADTKTIDGFHMSYGGYNRWRESLSLAVLGVMPQDVWVDLDAYRDRPFFELINFTDCDGVLSASAAAALLADFREHRDAYRTYLAREEAEDRADWWAESYDEYIEMLALAAHGGMVEYH